MRCKFCGWSNPDHVTQCEKCGNPTEGGTEEAVVSSERSDGDVDDKKTVVFRRGHRDAVSERHRCPNCSYPLLRGMTVCPQCKYELRAEDFPVVATEGNPSEQVANQAEERTNENVDKKTYNPYLRPKYKKGGTGFLLTPVAQEGEELNLEKVSFTGNSVLLNRQNTEPDNNSITGKAQASVTYEDGQWFIEDRSSQRTTFVRASRKTGLKDGDVILLGNRMFVFEETK